MNVSTGDYLSFHPEYTTNNMTTPLPPDTESPSVSMTSPANGSVVSGVVTVSADASDNVAVAGVQFQLDGANLGAEDTVPPFSIGWDSTTVANGVYLVQLITRGEESGDDRRHLERVVVLR